MARVLIPLPASDFDPTEAAVSWKVITDAGHQVCFATPTGDPATADLRMITGEGLDPWGWVPGLRHFVAMGRILRADAAGRDAYAATSASSEFNDPIRWEDIDLDTIDGLLLPGGHHSSGMRPYLESPILQRVVVDTFRRDMPVAAICHGVLLAARSINPDTDRSVLLGRKTTSLTWRQERLASLIGRIVRFWEPDYYRTYLERPGQPRGYMSVQAEVTRYLASPADYIDVDPDEPHARLKNDGRHRDSLHDQRPAHVVIDGNYVSARWPGDAHTFAKRYVALLDKARRDTSPKHQPLRPGSEQRADRSKSA
jgi:putative intracellular protease/amidase